MGGVGRLSLLIPLFLASVPSNKYRVFHGFSRKAQGPSPFISSSHTLGQNVGTALDSQNRRREQLRGVYSGNVFATNGDLLLLLGLSALVFSAAVGSTEGT